MTVSEGRRRLEKTLASPALTDKESVYRLVYNQLVASSSDSQSNGEEGSSKNKNIHNLAQSRFLKLWDLLELLRSASGEENRNLSFADAEETSAEGWKLKHDTGQMRSMYREGPKGTPFHTLLAEGLIYSPIMNALCLAWEAPSYNLWWPQLTIPTFKVIESRWVKRGRIGEDLSLIRVKVPWPLATREVLMHAFELEYVDEDLIIVLLHSAPDSPSTEEIIPGLKPSDIPDVLPTTVRMELAGGFALQRLTAEQSYFRTVANIDVKLDFVPPSLINFMSRQLVGLGFKLYQKTLTSFNNNEGHSQIFKNLIGTEPMYNRIEVNLQSRKANTKAENEQNLLKVPVQRLSADGNGPNSVMPTILEDRISHESGIIPSGDIISSISTDKPADETSEHTLAEPLHLAAKIPLAEGRDATGQGGICEGLAVDSEVQNALQTLDKMISLVRVYRSGSTKNQLCSESIAGSSQNPFLSSVDVLRNSANPGANNGLVESMQEQEACISESLEKLVPALEVSNNVPEHNLNSGISHILEAKERKLKRSCFCFRFPVLFAVRK